MQSVLEPSFFDQIADLEESAQPEFFGSFSAGVQVKFENENVVNEVFDCLNELRDYQLGISKSFDLKSIQSAIAALQIIERRAEEV